MEQIGYNAGPKKLDAVFAALADPTRRAILVRLAKGSASVLELAEPFSMSQPAVSRHLKVLERAGLVTREIDKQRRPAQLNANELQVAAQWIDAFSAFWTESLDGLDVLLETMKQSQKGEENSE